MMNPFPDIDFYSRELGIPFPGITVNGSSLAEFYRAVG